MLSEGVFSWENIQAYPGVSAHRSREEGQLRGRYPQTGGAIRQGADRELVISFGSPGL